MTPTDPVVLDRYKDTLDKTAFFSTNVKVDLHQSIDIDRYRSISIGHCIVFLKKSLRKPHFGSFSAVSEAPEACELAFCAEFNGVSICTHKKFLEKCKKAQI